MTVQECYAIMQGDYDDVLSRFRNDERIKKFALMFLRDTSYQLLCDSLEKSEFQEAFRASHTLKGVCQNLGFKKLYQSSHELTELLRGEPHGDYENVFKQLKEDYELTYVAVKSLQD